MCAADSAPKVLLRRTRSSLHVRGDSKISAVNTYTCVILGIFQPAVCSATFRDAIKPFKDRKIGSSFEVWVERAGREQINALIRIYRGPIAEIELRYQVLWDGIERTNDSYNIGRIANPLSAPLSR